VEITKIRDGTSGILISVRAVITVYPFSQREARAGGAGALRPTDVMVGWGGKHGVLAGEQIN
jgi:hypothetical protein